MKGRRQECVSVGGFFGYSMAYLGCPFESALDKIFPHESSCFNSDF